MKKGSAVDTSKDSVKRRLLLRRIIDSNGCWLWTGAVMGNGYGVIGMRIGGRKGNRLVHRASAWAFGDFDILDPLLVLHRCDVRRCFNPDHLFRGTQLDNIKDAWSKGRFTNEMQRHPTKLTCIDVVNIRHIYANSDHTTRSLAKEWGIGKTHVGAIIRRDSWRHI